MGTENRCSTCGKALKANAPGGLCPECLIKVGLGSGVDPGADAATGATRRDFVPPPVEELGPLFPQLEILELIGKGGMGAVYKARQRELDRIVALKILPPDIGQDAAFAERFTREARALAKLNHPGIVTLYEFGRANGLYFFLMEYVDGVNLRRLLAGGRVSAREALAIVPQICDALQYAHDQGIVHRDIKPENILLDRRGRVKVADFGLAKLVGADALTPSLSHPMGEGDAAAPGEGSSAPVPSDASQVMGTPQYMSPEQISAPGEVDHRADIYALGVVFYQMLTGELPGKPIQPPSTKVQIDVRLDEVVLRALEQKPELRYQQASVFKTQIETISRPAEASTAGKPWQSPTMGWGHFIGYLFGCTFTSPLAYKLANLSALGFLGCLAFLSFLPLPGMRGCLGFSGFFGFFGLIGLAFIVEICARGKRGDPSVRHFEVVGRRGGKAVVNWPAVLLSFVIALAVGESFTAVASLVLVNRIVPGSLITVFCSVLATIAAIVISKKLTTPLDKLNSLDAPVDNAKTDERSRRFGKLALAFCLGGLVLGQMLILLPSPAKHPAIAVEWIYYIPFFCGIAAIVLGISGWKSRAGKAVVIVMVLLLLVDLLLFLILQPHTSFKTSGAVSAPEIESVEITGDKAVVKQRSFHGEGMIITFGTMTNRWEPKHPDSLFSVTLQGHSPGPGADWVIKRRDGMSENWNYMLDSPPGTMVGKIVFHPGTPAPEADGSYVIGEFQPIASVRADGSHYVSHFPADDGKPLPIAVRLARDGTSQGSPPRAHDTGREDEAPGVHAPQTKADAPGSEARLRQIQAAQVELPYAEAELARLTKLHSSNAITDQDFSEAKYKVEELNAESKGDNAGALRIRLRQAEENLARARDLLGRSLISQEDYEQAKLKVELLQAQLAPVPVPSQSTNREREHR